MIRALQAEDIGPVAEIWLNTNRSAHSFSPSQYWEGHLPAVQEALAQAEVYVYEEEGAVQGFVGLNGNYIEGIFVRQEAQSQGIGKGLLDFVKARKDRLELSVYQKNSRAAAFYQREQFVIQREGRDEPTGELEYQMVWVRQGRHGTSVP